MFRLLCGGPFLNTSTRLFWNGLAFSMHSGTQYSFSGLPRVVKAKTQSWLGANSNAWPYFDERKWACSSCFTSNLTGTNWNLTCKTAIRSLGHSHRTSWVTPYKINQIWKVQGILLHPSCTGRVQLWNCLKYESKCCMASVILTLLLNLHKFNIAV